MKTSSTNEVSNVHRDICAEFDRIVDKAAKVNLVGYAQFRAEITAFMQYVLYNLKPNNPVRFMEIGMLAGENFVFMGNNLAKYFGETIGIGIDLDQHRFMRAAGLKLSQAIPMWNPGFKYHLVIGNSHLGDIQKKTERLLEGNKLDLLFVDGDHSAQGSMKDWEMYSPMVRKGGIIVFDDIKGGAGQVPDTWKKIRGKKFVELHITEDRAGIGIVRK